MVKFRNGDEQATEAQFADKFAMIDKPKFMLVLRRMINHVVTVVPQGERVQEVTTEVLITCSPVSVSPEVRSWSIEGGKRGSYATVLREPIAVPGPRKPTLSVGKFCCGPRSNKIRICTKDINQNINQSPIFEAKSRKRSGIDLGENAGVEGGKNELKVMITRGASSPESVEVSAHPTIDRSLV